jgi:hypothetical protein
MGTSTVYVPRRIEPGPLQRVGEWKIKTYTITCRNTFESKQSLKNAVLSLPAWLENARTLGYQTHGVAFLIVHEGRDGIWTLINWWLGDGDLLQGEVFFSPFDNLSNYVPMRGTGLMACVWEMEVINFEREMWVKHVLKRPDSPNFDSYLLSGYRCGMSAVQFL